MTQKLTNNMLNSLASSKLTGTLPALDGSSLTGFSAATKSASDPTTSTNPSGGVGTVWTNTTSGSVFICTDATAGSNVWKNIGDGEGDVINGKTAWVWGRNYLSALGIGDITNPTNPLGNWSFHTSPVLLGGESSTSKWTKVHLMNYHGFGVQGNGTLWSWGSHGNGRRGTGLDSGEDLLPTQIGSANTWADISIGDVGRSEFTQHMVYPDGTLWGTGSYQYGKMGNGVVNGGHRTTFIQIGTDTDWKQVTSGKGVLATKTDGTLWAWGRNNGGQLGLGNLTNKSLPTQVGTNTNWSFVESHGEATKAITTDGTIFGWGYRPGDGSNRRSSPVQVGASSEWASVTTGYYTGGGVKKNGELWTWGNGAYGSLGNNQSSASNTPVQVGSDTTWSGSQISSGRFNFAVLKADGTLWTWGRGTEGSTGHGNSTHYSSPVQVGTNNNWTFIQNTGQSMIGLTD